MQTARRPNTKSKRGRRARKFRACRASGLFQTGPTEPLAGSRGDQVSRPVGGARRWRHGRPAATPRPPDCDCVPKAPSANQTCLGNLANARNAKRINLAHSVRRASRSRATRGLPKLDSNTVGFASAKQQDTFARLWLNSEQVSSSGELGQRDSSEIKRNVAIIEEVKLGI